MCINGALLWRSLVLGNLAFTGIAAAQVSDTGTLAEIIVTARKFEENLQNTPVAVTAFSGSELDERQIFKTDRLDEVVPNLQFANNAPLAGNNSSSAVFIRGIGQTDPTSTVDPGVGLYIDEVYMGTFGGREHGAARYRLGAGAAWSAGHIVRPQHHRRGDRDVDARPGR